MSLAFPAHPLASTLLGIGFLGSVTSAIFTGLVVVAAERFRRRRTAERSQPSNFLPPLSVLKPLHGAEPGLERNLRSYFTQEYAGEVELLFCARQESDAGLAIARRLAAEYPARRTRILACGEPQFPNPKMYSLAVMAEAAQSPILVTSDADARVAPDHLDRLVQGMREPDLDLAFSLYLAHADTADPFLYLDVLGKSIEMNAGVLVASLLAPVDFSLGVTVIQRRDVFTRAGGFADLGSYWAEDFVLGNRLAAQGRKLTISTEVIRLVVTADGALQSFQNQLRWAQSTRRSRPLGHLGNGLVFAMPFALLGSAVEAARGQWAAAAAFLLVAAAQRMLLAATVLRALGSTTVVRDALAYPVRDLYGFLIWLCSYLPGNTRYHGTHFRILPDGRLSAPEQRR